MTTEPLASADMVERVAAPPDGAGRLPAAGAASRDTGPRLRRRGAAPRERAR